MMRWILSGEDCKHKELQYEEPPVHSTGSVYFIGVIEEWRLTNINAIGTRMSTVNFDGDGWTGNPNLNIVQGEELDAP